MSIVRIQSINIKNIRNLTINIDLASNVNGLFGPNGCGKTSILYAIKLLKSILSGEKFSVDYFGDEVEDVSIGIEFLVKDYSGSDYLVNYEVTFNKEAIIKEVFAVGDEIVEYSGIYEESQVFNINSCGLAGEIRDYAVNKIVLLFNTDIVRLNLQDFYIKASAKPVNLLHPLQLSDEELIILNNVLDKINYVLMLVIGRKLGLRINSDSRYVVTLGSVDLVEESSGIQNMVQLVINLIPLAVDPGRCLCVDNLGGDTFNPLLIEIIKAVDSCLAGQIIFTSHQLSLLDEFKNSNVYCFKDGNILGRYTSYNDYLKYIYCESSKLPSRAHLAVAFRNSAELLDLFQ